MQLTRADVIAAAVAYADIFDYPLTEKELRTWLLFYVFKRPRLVIVQGEALRRLKRVCVASVVYYGLRRVNQLVKVRRQRIIWSKKKMLTAQTISWWFRLVPTIMLVGVTGGLAMANAKKEDDIDLFFVTQKGTLWISRLLTTVIAELLGVRRRPLDTKVMNKVCLNMFMTKDALTLPKRERDVFAAHEVLQMVPLWEREGVYKKFLSANRWVKKFLPNAWKEKKMNYDLRFMNYEKKISSGFSFINRISYFILRLCEPIARYVQIQYMKHRKTNEVITRSVIRFHPHDARVWVKQALARRLKRFNIPLDKVFYGR